MRHPQSYHLSIDWRRAKFSMSHPEVTPDVADPVTVPTISLFLPCTCIREVLAIRDWLHAQSLPHHLLGCYESFTRLFGGIVFVFETAADLLLFRQQWEPVKTLAPFGRAATI